MKSENSYLKNVENFLIDPRPNNRFNLNLLLKIKYLIFSFLLIFFCAFVATVFNHILVVTNIMPRYENRIESRLLEIYNVQFVNIIAILIAPVLEELTHRSGLLFSRTNIAISFSLFFFLIFSYLTGGIYVFDIVLLFKIFFTFIIFISIIFLLKNKGTYTKLNDFWNEKYLVIFYTSSIFFGYLHLSNFGELSLEKLLFSPFLVLQFILYGIIFGFVRITMGLRWSILLHIILNAFMGLLRLL